MLNYGKQGWNLYQEDVARRKKVIEVLLQKYDENDDDYHHLVDYLTRPYVIRVARIEINNRKEDIKEYQKDGQFVDDMKAEVTKLEKALIKFVKMT